MKRLLIVFSIALAVRLSSALAGYLDLNAPGGYQEKVADPTGTKDDSAALRAALSQGDVLLGPAAKNWISQDVEIPAGRALRIQGTLRGTGRLIALGSVTLDGGGAIQLRQSPVDGVAILVKQGTILIENLHFIGGGTNHIDARPGAYHAATNWIGNDSMSASWPRAIVLRSPSSGTATVSSFIVRNCTAEHYSNFVLREDLGGNTSVVLMAEISGNVISNTANGDPINWNNVSGGDSNVTICNNVIQHVSWTRRNRAYSDWSPMAIAIAGQVPSVFQTCPTGSCTAHHFIIRSNVITGVPTGIHVEYASNVEISGNDIRDVSWKNHVSPAVLEANSTAPNAGKRIAPKNLGIEIYGVEHLLIRNNRIQDVFNDAGHFLTPNPSGTGDNANFWGIFVEGVRTPPSFAITWLAQDVVIAQNTLVNASIHCLSMANPGSSLPSRLSVLTNRVEPGSIEILGRGTIDISGNKVGLSKAYLPPSNPRVGVPYQGTSTALAFYRINEFGRGFASTHPMRLAAKYNFAKDSARADSMLISQSNKLARDIDLIAENNPPQRISIVSIGRRVGVSPFLKRAKTTPDYHLFSITSEDQVRNRYQLIWLNESGTALKGREYFLDPLPCVIPPGQSFSDFYVRKLLTNDTHLTLTVDPVHGASDSTSATLSFQHF